MDGADRIDLYGHRSLDHVHLLCFVIYMSAEHQRQNVNYSFILNIAALCRVICTDPETVGQSHTCSVLIHTMRKGEQCRPQLKALPVSK